MITVNMHDTYYERASRLLKPFPLMILFYLLPEDAVKSIKLEAVPRCPLQFVADDFFTTRYFGKAFPKRLMKLWATFMWACLDMKGWVTDYSEDDPMYMLIHDPDIWFKVLGDIGYDTNWLATESVSIIDIPHPGVEESAERFLKIAECFWNHPDIKAAEIYEVVRTHRTHTDFAFRESNAKKDFHRSYNHTQSQYQTISFNVHDHEIRPDKLRDVDMQNVDIRDSWNCFCKRLKGKHDETIFKMTYLGYTQKEIADYIGYADQGAVSKRLKYIWAEYHKHQELDNNPPQKPSTIKYDIIPFSYKRATV